MLVLQVPYRLDQLPSALGLSDRTESLRFFCYDSDSKYTQRFARVLRALLSITLRKYLSQSIRGVGGHHFT